MGISMSKINIYLNIVRYLSGQVCLWLRTIMKTTIQYSNQLYTHTNTVYLTFDVLRTEIPEYKNSQMKFNSPMSIHVCMYRDRLKISNRDFANPGIKFECSYSPI